MKKIILGVFLLMSALSFAAGRKVPIEKMMVDMYLSMVATQKINIMS